MKRVERLHALSEMLQRGGARGYSADRLAREFAVSTRTIKRDLAALSSSGAAVWSRPGPGGGYGLAAGSTLPPVTLSSTQASALLAAVAAAPDAPYADQAAAGVQKILDVLDPVTRGRAVELAGRVWVNTVRAPSRAVRSALDEAMTAQRVVRLRYRSAADEITDRDVEPMLFASTNGQWYLIAWCRLRGAIRWFAITRVDRASVTAQPCTAHSLEEIGVPPQQARPAHGREWGVGSRN
ncbi:helix-turn-helix transcriptional regulator [Curtobacterium sp. 20TX0008]|uniref:helix-turn-helix transcriptional regulator n=1 Tax=Curtobacterium sp. 20TX0008 TaxID=3022018 RepID=UPI00232D3C7A|nr:WYL domain-containing protein [Curtobacterium sp. 20TX0008]MDB6426192.1 WYL domain-containing protein [Curtobacterium sp. 20TX0008]